MFKKQKQYLKQFVRALIATAAFLVAFPAASQIEVSFEGFDIATGGDYRNAGYGNCFSVIAQASPRTQYPEVEVGPDFFSLGTDSYDNRCTDDMVDDSQSGCTASGGPIPNREPGINSAVCITEEGVALSEGVSPTFFDFRFFLNNYGSEYQAYAWSFLEPNNNGKAEPFEIKEGLSRPASQYNACLDVLRASTFDNGLYEFDPLTGEVKIVADGDATIAYYFS